MGGDVSRTILGTWVTPLRGSPPSPCQVTHFVDPSRRTSANLRTVGRQFVQEWHAEVRVCPGPTRRYYPPSHGATAQENPRLRKLYRRSVTWRTHLRPDSPAEPAERRGHTDVRARASESLRSLLSDATMAA
jgi:hypothetical protein